MSDNTTTTFTLPVVKDVMNPEFAAALVAALGELASIDRSRTANAGQYAYRYVDLATVLAAVRPVLAPYGLGVVQDVETVYGDKAVTVSVATVILHCSGATHRSPPLRLVAAPDPQKVGSAITYARRYSLMATLGIAAGDDDDDGQAARHLPTTPPAVSAESRRTAEEKAIRATMRELDPQYRVALQEAFKREFGSSLSGLDPARHVEALGWVTDRISADLAHELAEASQDDPHTPEDPYQ